MTPENLAALKAVVSRPEYAGMSAEKVVDSLHYREPYDIPAAPMAKQLSIAEMMGALSPSSVGNLLSLPCFTDLRDKVLAQDRQAIGLYGMALAAAGKITVDEKSAIDAMLVATVTPPPTTGYRKSTFDLELRFLPEFPNKIRVSDIEEARAV